jgi:hypothetical protein
LIAEAEFWELEQLVLELQGGGNKKGIFEQKLFLN